MDDYLLLRKALLEVGPRGTWIDLADSAEEAAALATADEPDAIVVSSNLPDQDSFRLIQRLLVPRSDGTRPSLFLLVDESFPPGFSADAIRRYPAISVFEKPFVPAEVARAIFETVIPRGSRHLKFYNLKLFDLLYTYIIRRHSVTLRVVPPQGPMGAIFVREGQLLHAAYGELDGLAALDRIAHIQVGRIRIDVGCATALSSIDLPPKAAIESAMQLMTAYTDRGFLRKDGSQSQTATKSRSSQRSDPTEQSTDYTSRQRRGQRRLQPLEHDETGNPRIFALRNISSGGTTAPAPKDLPLNPPDPLSYLDESTQSPLYNAHPEEATQQRPKGSIDATRMSHEPEEATHYFDERIDATRASQEPEEETRFLFETAESTQQSQEPEEDTRYCAGDEQDETLLRSGREEDTLWIDFGGDETIHTDDTEETGEQDRNE